MVPNILSQIKSLVKITEIGFFLNFIRINLPKIALSINLKSFKFLNSKLKSGIFRNNN